MLALPVRALFTAYILVIGIGLLMSGIQILLTHGMADGWQVWHLTRRIGYSYRGNSSDNKLETKLKGSMQDKASTEAKTGFDTVGTASREYHVRNGTIVLV